MLVKVCLKFTLYQTGRTYRVVLWKFFLSLSLYDFVLHSRRVFEKKKVSRTKTICSYIFFAFACPSYILLSFLSPFFSPRKRRKKKDVREEETERMRERAKTRPKTLSSKIFSHWGGGMVVKVAAEERKELFHYPGNFLASWILMSRSESWWQRRCFECSSTLEGLLVSFLCLVRNLIGW